MTSAKVAFGRRRIIANGAAFSCQRKTGEDAGFCL
jgi:hypothetical protein